MSETSKKRMLTMRSGGWVLVLSGVLTMAVFVWAVLGAILAGPLIGDGRNVESYGFDLQKCLVPRDRLVAGGLRKDALKALNEAPVMAGGEVRQFNAEMRGKFLVSSDRVIGVVIKGVARAYPLLIMQVHEIANDVVGGVPIAVTYNPLCDSIAVFDRRIGEEVLEFGVSGLLYNSNMLMFDRRPDAAGESLWSQLGRHAIAGPAAGTRLRLMPATLASWADWLRAYPDTTVLRPDPRMQKRYKETKYATYFLSESLMFPVSPEPPADGPALKQRIVVVDDGTSLPAWTIASIAARADEHGVWRTRQGNRTLRFQVRPETETVIVTDDLNGRLLPTIHAFWFAWHAIAEKPSLFRWP